MPFHECCLGQSFHTQAVRVAPVPAGQPRSQQYTANPPTAVGAIAPDAFLLRGLTEVWFSLVNNRPLSKQSSSLKKGRRSLVIVPIVWPGKNLGHLQWPQIETTWTPVLPLKNNSGLLLKKKNPTTKQSKVSHKKSLLFGMDFEKKNNYIDRVYSLSFCSLFNITKTES